MFGIYRAGLESGRMRTQALQLVGPLCASFSKKIKMLLPKILKDAEQLDQQSTSYLTNPA